MARGKKPVLDEQGRKKCPRCNTPKSLDRFQVEEGRPFDRSSWCLDCKNDKTKSKYNLAYYRNLHLIRSYGITSKQYEAMLEDQGGVCASCKRPERQKPGRTRRTNGPSMLHVDHDHTTGVVRGLLCNACNTALAALDDNPKQIRALLSYIEARIETREELTIS